MNKTKMSIERLRSRPETDGAKKTKTDGKTFSISDTVQTTLFLKGKGFNIAGYFREQWWIFGIEFDRCHG